MTSLPNRLKLLRGRGSRRASSENSTNPQSRELSAIRLPSRILTDTTIALINRTAGLNVLTPGPPPAENIAPQPQHTVQGPEGGGSANAQFPDRKPEALWEEALEGLKKEERKAWDSYPISQSQPAGHRSIDEQINLIREARDSLTDKQMIIQRGDGQVIIVREKINSVLKVMDKYMAIGNIAIQHSPTITALVWAGVRLGLQLALNEMKTFEELTSALEDIGNIVSCCRIYEELYLSSTYDSANAVVDALPPLYTTVLRFIIEMRGYYDMKGLSELDNLRSPKQYQASFCSLTLEFIASVERSLKAIIPFEVQFQPLMDAMKQRKEEVDKRARVAHEVFVQKNMISSDEDTKKRVENLVDQLGSFGADISSLHKNVGNMLLHQEANKRRDVLGWLSEVKCEDHHQEVVKVRLEGTGTWVLQRQEIRDWLESEESSVLWLHGKAGSGKTILSSRIIDALSATHGSSSPVLFFYCNYKEQPRREANGILRALLKQISGTMTALDPELVSTYDRAKSKGFNATSIHASSTELLFRRALPTFKATYVVIDALDECEEAERKELVTALKSHTALKNYVLKVFMTSRDEKDLARMLSGTSDFRINADDTALDIRPFVEIQVEESINNGEILGRKENVTLELRKDLVDTLVSKADGMFLWVKYQLEHIRIQGSEHDLRTQLGKLPRGLDETYAQILEKIDKLGNTQKGWAYKVLKWVTCAARPLTQKELLQATAIKPGSSTFEPSKMSNIVYLIEVCCHLIILDSLGLVRFVHYSVQEFLQSRSEFSESQELVASTCITSLGLWKDLGVPETRSHLSGIHNYAAKNWPLHVQQLSAVGILPVLPILQKIFSNARHFKVWTKNSLLRNSRTKVPLSEAPAYLAVCSFLGFTTAVEHFLQDETTGLQAKWYALRAAAAAGNQAMIELLLDNRVDVNAQDGKHGNALQEAARHGDDEVTRLLLKRGADIDAQGGEYGNALQTAAYHGEEAVVRLLLENGADINAQGGEYGNALQAAAARYWRASAAYHRKEEVVRLLLENGAEINAQGGKYGSVLLAAARSGDEAVVRLLLESGADIDACGGKYGNALQAAARSGDEAVVRLLLENGADINAQGGEYGSALQAAVCWGTKVVPLLLENGADINAQGGVYGNVLQAAAYCAMNVVPLLLKNGADINTQGGLYGNALQAAAAHSYRVTVVRLLLENGADINARGGKYGNVLQAAAATRGGGEEVVRLLLESGADINAQGGEYGNALQAAAGHGSEKVVSLLLENGADINAQGGVYGNALQAAATRIYGGRWWIEFGKEEVVRLLLENGADINAQGGKYGNALQAAAAAPGGSEVVVRLLLENGADINAQGGEYGNTLQAAAWRGSEKVVSLLLENGADVNAQGGRFGNALQAAAFLGWEAVVRLLLESRADINAQGGEYGNALQAAAFRGEWEVAQSLLENGADINAQGGEYGNALQAAAHSGREVAVRLLLEYGADINAQGKYGNALQAAECGGHEAVTQLLLGNRAESVAKDRKYGRELPVASPPDIAVKRSSPDLETTSHGGQQAV